MSVTSLVRSTLNPKDNSPAPATTSQTPTRALANIAAAALPKLALTRDGSTPGKGPSTPPTTPSSAASTPGKWQHPRMNEVIQRQSKTRFDNTNMRTILANVALLVSSFVLSYATSKTLPRSWLYAVSPAPTLILLGVRLLFLGNIVAALIPRFRKPDACEDVPLTPAQRAMLGLPPMSRPATPLEKEEYVTPPRYSRSATPQSSGNSGLRATSGSPLSGRGTPLEPGTSFFGTGSPSSAARSGGERRRLSYTSARSSPLSISEFDAAGNANTPTKTTKASVGLNNKWLYERGRASPRGSPRTSGTLFSGAGQLS